MGAAGQADQRAGRDHRSQPGVRPGIPLGFPAIRLLPYQAEIAFNQRDFPRVRRLLRRNVVVHCNSEKTQALVRFWRKPDRHDEAAA